MYQFTELFKDVNASAKPKSFRWRGLAIGITFGWLPAWALVHFSQLGGWFFPLLWLGCGALGYALGSAIKK